MAQQDEGIMALNAANAGAGMPPEDTEIDMYEFRRQAYPAAKDAMREVDPAGYGEMQSLLSSELAGAGDLDPEGVEELLQLVDYINENPEQYPEIRAAMISEGMIDEDDFPAEMDVEYFATLEVVLQEAMLGSDAQAAEMAQGPVGMMPPQGFAKGGIAEAAQIVANRGRYGDTMLAHITPEEARLLRSRGGSGTINPETGLPEFFRRGLKRLGRSVKKAVQSPVKAVAKQVKRNVKSVAKQVVRNVKVATKVATAPNKAIIKAVKPVVRKVLASPVGRMAATIGLTMIGVPPPLASALVTKAAGGTWKDAFKAAAVSYLAGPTSPLAPGVEAATPFLSGMNPAVATGIRSGLTSTGASLLTGSNLKEAVTAGVTSGLVAGIDAARNPVPVATPDAALDAATAPAAAGDAPFQLASATPDQQFGLGPDAFSLAPPAPDASPYGLQPSAFDLSSGTADSGFGVRAPPTAPAGAPAAPASRFGEFLPSAGQPQPGAGAPPPVDDRSMYQKAKEFYNENISPSGIREAGEGAAQDAGLKARASLLQKDPNASTALLDSTYQAAYKNALPGVISQYAPMVGAGLGVMALTGGFSPREAEQLPMAERISAPMEVPPTMQTPMQNLPGVVYDSRGNIIGSRPFNPATSATRDMRPAEVQTPGIMSLQLPPSYMPPPGSPTMGGGPVQQPFNTSAMYPSLMEPRRYNAGGIAGFAQGGYPRRIGQIDGPGTETSDDIPAMLSDGEFVMTARAVRGAGNGSRREGAKKMYSMMHQLEKNAARG